jgi:hypothetical protein
MALTSTTLASPVSVNDVSIVVSSAAGFAVGMPFRIDSEWGQVAKGYVAGSTTIPCSRGFDGSATAAHKSGANVTVGLASDFQTPLPQTMVTAPLQAAWPIYSYSASGAIPPIAGVHVLNGTGALTMTLTSPTKDQDGQILILIANGKAAHTVTYTTAIGWGGGAGASDVATFTASYQVGSISMAMNGVWVLIGNGLFSAGTQVGGVAIA